ncbi:PREDICTED: serologically defined colon cancer antigen 3 homolog [Nestor notabilis]|uniref:serologically defined colon cancer antigen 3 homolog n=1 Tax=Nestor notabilis TaxID=176057 RepID=UPI00052374DF|nr:PREDICTED: serologically defined colon cancer antigen 3 homolog [Nestor notabilis]
MSWLLDSSGTTERICPESQVLEDDDDDNDELNYSCHSVYPPPQSKNYESVSDNQVEDLGEAIPFPLNSKHSHLVKDEGEKNRIYAEKLAEYAQELEEEAQESQTPFYKDMEGLGSLSEDEEHSWACHFPMRQRSHVLRTASTASCGSYGSFPCSTGNHLGIDAFALWAHASDPYLGYRECTKGAEPHMLYEEAIGDRQFLLLQLTNDVLREENTILRKVVKSMQSSMKSQVCMIQKLERQLKARLDKEKRDAQELQSFIQRSEWNLQLMTQRALEAESNVEKLKQKIYVLQGELESSKAENKNLKAGQTADLGTTKHNIDFALQNLHKIITGANWSIKQLISGAESLHFVAEVLESTGKIHEV